MKTIIFAFLLFIAFSSAALIKPSKISMPLNVVPPTPRFKGVELCKVCVSFMSNAIQDLIEIIANAGIGGKKKFII